SQDVILSPLWGLFFLFLLNPCLAAWAVFLLSFGADVAERGFAGLGVCWSWVRRGHWVFGEIVGWGGGWILWCGLRVLCGVGRSGGCGRGHTRFASGTDQWVRPYTGARPSTGLPDVGNPEWSAEATGGGRQASGNLRRWRRR